MIRPNSFGMYILFAWAVSAHTLMAAEPAVTDATEAAVNAKLQFGAVTALPLPRSLLFSLSPDRIIADAAAWKAMGVGGFFLEGVASEWSTDIWGTDGKPHTIGPSDETFQKVCRANDECKRLGMSLFLKIVYANPLEWFNETAWQHIEHNFRQFALFARDAGCVGIALDIEYVGQQYAFDWSGYDYAGYTRKDLIKKVRERSTLILNAMYDEFPSMEFLVLPEEGFSLGGHIETAWIEEAARRQAPGGIHFCMESTYTTASIPRLFAQTAVVNQLLHRLLSPAAQAYWEQHCSLAAGIWPTGFDIEVGHDPKSTPAELRASWAGNLMVSKRYNWVYIDRYAEQHMGRKLEEYKGNMDFALYTEVLRAKEMVTNAPEVAEAQRLRALSSGSLEGQSLTPVPRFMFPYVVPVMEFAETSTITTDEADRAWRIALDYYNGEQLNLPALFSPVRDWKILGPFPSGDSLEGHKKVFAPEQAIDFAAEYEGAEGKIKWQAYHVPEGKLGIDFKELFTPNEKVTAYAACYVISPITQEVQARFASNDAGKLWIGGVLVNDFGRESWSVLDRDIIRVTLPKGRTPILAKVTNGIGSWALVLRFTDANGNPVSNLAFDAEP